MCSSDLSFVFGTTKTNDNSTNMNHDTDTVLLFVGILLSFVLKTRSCMAERSP